ncbi:MAG TPA: mannose-1-phosphate guanylyltransferase/mannose-6-phosphate isomerase [Stellaceae bacterium]|nr:mannose-1-phosphate guanylyltransferase/mannose-6-phosphate isomerase [Stellaceae bacterium]
MAEAVLHPVILSGGAGSRLWPMSRTGSPKQLLPLISEKSLLQETVLRLAGAGVSEPPLIIANDEHRFVIAEQLRQIGVTPRALLLEPVARNTAPAVAAAASYLGATDPGALMLVMPSDHTIRDEAAFARAIATGREAAAGGYLVTFGITADRPETGYGYIRRGAPLEIDDVYRVDAFVEKPDRARAEAYIADGIHSWNSGIFLFPAALYLEELARYMADTAAAAVEAVAAARADPDFVRLDAAAFGRAINQSIDYAVMERTERAAVVPVTMGWSDVGTWDALWEVAPARDATGNVTLGDVVAVACSDSYLRSEEQLLAAYGVDSLVVVATPDAVLVAPRDCAQEVKQVVDALKRGSRPELAKPTTSQEAWGTWRTLRVGGELRVFHLAVRPGGRLPLRVSGRREEHWLVVRGVAEIVKGGETLVLGEGGAITLPPGVRHGLGNPGDQPLDVIAVVVGGADEADDVVLGDKTESSV